MPRFNERFVLSLGKCPSCLVCDDELNILPLSKAALQSLGDADRSTRDEAGEVAALRTREDDELEELKAAAATKKAGQLNIAGRSSGT